jgi:hypothetical protein
MKQQHHVIRSKADMADMLERFFDLVPPGDHATGWEWDDLENCPFDQPELERWRQRVLAEVGPLVAPSRGPEEDKLADERIAIIINELRQDKDA